MCSPVSYAYYLSCSHLALRISSHSFDASHSRVARIPDHFVPASYISRYASGSEMRVPNMRLFSFHSLRYFHAHRPHALTPYSIATLLTCASSIPRVFLILLRSPLSSHDSFRWEALREHLLSASGKMTSIHKYFITKKLLYTVPVCCS